MIVQTGKMGNITLTPEVITTLAGAAATNCFGVRGMAKRGMSDGLVHLLKREAMGKGVLVTYGEDQTLSIELHIIVNFGINLSTVTSSIMDEVRYKVEAATGMKVAHVDVYVDSILID